MDELGRNFPDAIEILSGRLYFISSPQCLLHDSTTHYFFSTDNSDEYHYERFCAELQFILKSFKLSKKICYYTSSVDQEKRSNAAYLIGSFAIICLGHSAAKICQAFEVCEKTAPFLPFRDASPGESTYGLHLSDIFSAVEKAVHLKWIDLDRFNVEEYEHFERVENGDMNWILPGKILAFCGPHLKSVVDDGYPRHSPETYFDYFRKHNVTNVVRLNRKNYESSRFTEAGFVHSELFFVDGSTPSNAIVLKFIKLVEEAQGAVAVHCKAGLGRTGTLIACYMMKHYGFKAPECMAWIRICRPGCIIGPQQQFLIHVQNWCRSLPGSTDAFRSPKSICVYKTDKQIFFSKTISQAIDNVKLQDNQETAKKSPVAAQNQKRKLSTSCTNSQKFTGVSQGESLMRIKGNRSTTHVPLASLSANLSVRRSPLVNKFLIPKLSIADSLKPAEITTPTTKPVPGPKPRRRIAVDSEPTNQKSSKNIFHAPRRKYLSDSRPSLSREQKRARSDEFSSEKSERKSVTFVKKSANNSKLGGSSSIEPMASNFKVGRKKNHTSSNPFSKSVSFYHLRSIDTLKHVQPYTPATPSIVHKAESTFPKNMTRIRCANLRGMEQRSHEYL